jgi:hypothetical protein
MSRVAMAVHGPVQGEAEKAPGKPKPANEENNTNATAAPAAPSEPDTAVGNALSRAMNRLRGRD